MGAGTLLVLPAVATVFVARARPAAGVVLVALLGALHAQGLFAIPTPPAAQRAAAQVRVVQQQAIANITCQRAALAGEPC